MRLAHFRSLVFAVVSLTWTGVANASDPNSIYVVPTAVEQSSGSPARVVIHGAFFRLTSATAFTYGDPQCGVMTFECAAGDETLCRMQWTDVKTRITPMPTTCAGFGSLNIISSATLRAEGGPLGAPDAWDLGIGIGTGLYVDGKCPVAAKLVCPLGGGVDAGAAGGATVPGTGGSMGTGGNGSGGASSSGGATSSGGAIGSGGSGAGTGGAVGSSGGAGTTDPRDAGGNAGKGAPTGPSNHRSGGCAIGGGGPTTADFAAFGLLSVAGAMLLGGRRARRR